MQQAGTVRAGLTRAWNASCVGSATTLRGTMIGDFHDFQSSISRQLTPGLRRGFFLLASSDVMAAGPLPRRLAAAVGMFLCLLALASHGPGAARVALYPVASHSRGWWGGMPLDGFEGTTPNGGRRAWEGAADTFERYDDTPQGGPMASPSSPSSIPTRRSRVSGGVDITDVGEGTERVRLGLEGEWSGMASESRPGVGQEGAGAGFLGPASANDDSSAGNYQDELHGERVHQSDYKRAEGGGRIQQFSSAARYSNGDGFQEEEYPDVGSGFDSQGGYGDGATFDLLNPASGGRAAYPKTSSYAYPRTATQWRSRNGDFPGDIQEGTFPGVAPNDPDGNERHRSDLDLSLNFTLAQTQTFPTRLAIYCTLMRLASLACVLTCAGTSWMIGMHRDGEDVLGKWARAPRAGRTAAVRRQQLALLHAGVARRVLSRRDKGGTWKGMVLRTGRGRRVRQRPVPRGPAGGRGGREEELWSDHTGADITDIGETNRDHDVYGGYGDSPEPTSWVVGEHRSVG